MSTTAPPLSRPEDLTVDDLGHRVAVHGREIRPPCPIGPLDRWEGELLTVLVLPGGRVQIGLAVAGGARVRVQVERPDA